MVATGASMCSTAAVQGLLSWVCSFSRRIGRRAADGVIGSVAPRHFAFAGNQPDTVSELRLDTGPACAAELAADAVDVVLLTPV